MLKNNNKIKNGAYITHLTKKTKRIAKNKVNAIFTEKY